MYFCKKKMMNRKILNAELERKTIEEFKDMPKIPIVVVLDNVRSQNNVGSVFRTCDAFRLEGIILCGITATPANKELHKTALGAENSMSWKYYEQTLDAIKALKEQHYIIVSVEQTEKGMYLNDFIADPHAKYCFVFGNEMHGVNQQVVNESNFCIEIPQFGTKHSFNIAVSMGIVLWDVMTKLKP